MEIITSKQNQYVKLAKSLKDKKHRDQEGLYLAEGVCLAEEAVMSTVEIAYALINPEIEHSDRGKRLLQDLKRRQVMVYQLSEPLLKYCADTVNPQGVILVIKKEAISQKHLLAGNCAFYFLADRLQDPGNLGTILRTARAAGADGAILLDGSVDQYHPKVVRAAMGAVFNLPVYLVKDENEAWSLIKKAGLKIQVAGADGETVFNGSDLTQPLVWVLGSEAHGVSQFWRQRADNCLSLPLAKGVESLNVAVAAGVLFYETWRQRFGQ
ncbi:MAG: TrmH family RNA methyltransferase [Bacillota bacterium]|jgi:TrmH family RNA methyltransferase